MKRSSRSSGHSVFSIQNSELRRRRLPAHVAIIMDGNRRWARQRGLAAVMGHDKAARDVIEPIVDRAIQLGIKFLTFWAFSTENWKRDKAEIQALMGIFREGLKKLGGRLNEKGVRLHIIGEMSKFPEDIRKQTAHYLEISQGNKKITVSFALNYGGRDEMLRAIRKLITKLQVTSYKLQDINEEFFSQFLDTADMPDPDLIIRTGGEFRLSGYFPWQSVYSELYFTPTLWPDFTPEEFDKALEDYAGRERRFGGGAASTFVFGLLADVDIGQSYLFQGNEPAGSSFSTIGALVSQWLPNVYILAGIVLFFFVLLGGFSILTSGGQVEKIQQGQKTLGSALIGFAILFASYWIIQIIQVITGVPILGSGL